MKLRLLISLLAGFWLAAFLSTCSAPSSVLAPTNPVRERAVVTSVPSTKTPTRTATPNWLVTPVQAQSPTIAPEQVSAWGEICQQTLSTPASESPARFAPGSAGVLIQKASGEAWTRYTGLTEISAEEAGAVRYLICIKEESEHAFTYTGGKVEGKRRIWNVRLVNPENQVVFFSTRLVGSNPPSFTFVSKGTTVVMGGYPTDKLLNSLYGQFINLPPLTAREENQIISITFSPNGRYLLTLSEDGAKLSLIERSVDKFTRSNQLQIDNDWKPGNDDLKMAYTPDGDGLVVSSTRNHISTLYYLEIKRGVSGAALSLAASAPCFGANCEVGPVLEGNVIRRGDCEWKLGTNLICKQRAALSGGLLASSENGEWIALGAEFAPTPTPTAYLSKTPRPTNTTRPKAGTLAPLATAQPAQSAAPTLTKAVSPTLTRTPVPPPEPITLWNSSKGTLDWSIPVPPAPKSTSKVLNPPWVVFSPDGALIAVRYYDQFQIWDLKNAEQVTVLAGYDLIAFSPDGITLAAARPGRGVDLFDMSTLAFKETLTETFGEVGHLVFSADGTLLATSSGRMLRVWKLP